MTRRVAALALAVVALLAFVVRLAGIELVFVGDGTVVFGLGDAYYHARRAFFSFEHFPEPLLWDTLLNHPYGAYVPWPPLYDILLGGFARLFGDTQPVFERVAAWTPPVLGALTIWPVYSAGRRLGGRPIGLGSAVLFALFPATVHYSNVGNIDHHAAQALLGALLLSLSLAAVSPDEGDVRRVRRRFAALAVVRAALLLTWPGSLVYLVLCEGCLLVAGVLSGRRDLLAGEAGSAFASAVLVLPVVLVSGTPVGGPFSAIELSRLHVVLLVAVAIVGLALHAAEGWRPAPTAMGRLVRATALGVPILALLFLGTGAVQELSRGFDYVAKTDAYEGLNLEQYALFRFDEPGPDGASGFSDSLGVQSFGGFAYTIPLVPLAVLFYARTRRLRAPALVLGAWAAGLGTLALQQVRFANDYAPAGSVGFALLLALPWQFGRLRTRPALGRAVSVLLAWLLLVPVLEIHRAAIAGTIRALRSTVPADRALHTYAGSMVRFAQSVRAVTPPTAGFDDPSAAPAYGILSYPGIGHVLHYVARHATPADNFGPYIGSENYTAVGSFFGLRSEDEAVLEAERLRTRYVATTDYGGPVPWTLINRLHWGDGMTLGDQPALGRFRLVTEGPLGGRTIGEQFDRGISGKGPPYKLFEIVRGAVLEVRARPGESAVASVVVHTPTQRKFTWQTSATAGEDGVARLRVPYASVSRLPARAVQPYRVTVGDAAYAVTVPEEAVAAGQTIRVEEASP